MSSQHSLARPCRCEHPLLDGDGCFRCGRSLTVLPEPPPTRPHVRRRITWTRAGVVRAIRAFAFFRGRAPVLEDWKQRMGEEWPSLDTVEGIFGSLESAVRAAGVKPPRVRPVAPKGD